MRFGGYLVGLFVSVTGCFVLPVFAVVTGMGDTLGTVFTLGAVDDVASRDPQAGFVKENLGILMTLCVVSAVAFLGLMVFDKSGQTKVEKPEADQE